MTERGFESSLVSFGATGGSRRALEDAAVANGGLLIASIPVRAGTTRLAVVEGVLTDVVVDGVVGVTTGGTGVGGTPC